MNFKKIKAYEPWIIRGAILLVILLMANAWNSANKAKEALSKELEREKIEKAGLLAEREASKHEMKRKEEEFLKEHPDLKPEVIRLQKLLDEKPKIVEVIKWKTKVVEVPSDPQDATRECPQDNRKIVLIEGDQGHIEVGELTYETKAGNHVILGTASCFRDTPTPRLLFKSSVEAPVSTAFVPREPAQLRWGAGAFVAIAKDGWALGPKVLFPPVRVWNFQLEAEAGVAIGPSGTFVGQAGAGGRW